ncbi:DNA/RNA non-specific endonuclease [Woodsholea maritima]|uniref:DNA/RNA non-specific endonuclease n=1 Tax=Woodsholea maritima TaxID=240237 RepID=UPI00037F2ACB|nr:DNA/RNA non-specific endonuclease [Woodsholea maritima]
MAGYDPNFLDVSVPLPDYSARIAGRVLRSPTLVEEINATYVNYTVVMDRDMRAPFFAALNVDQGQFKTVPRSDKWRIDSRVGPDYQLNNDYYRDNPWDRGHLARKATAAWGRTAREAKMASDDTFFFTNACLQHARFNQDEWLALEEWVYACDLDRDGRLSVISGPIFGDFSRTITPEGRPPAMIPSAFFKVVMFMNKSDALETRAFIMMQDAEAMADRSGRKLFDYQNYQVSVTEIEERTGLVFPDVVPASNPLYFSDSTATRDARERLNVRSLPERIETNVPEELVGAREVRETVRDEEIDVFISAAMVNPLGDEREGEWVSILNLSNETIDLSGWTISDAKRTPKPLDGLLGPGEGKRIQPVSPLMLSNKGGVIRLMNGAGERVDRVQYAEEQGRKDGETITFIHRSLGWVDPAKTAGMPPQKAPIRILNPDEDNPALDDDL